MSAVAGWHAWLARVARGALLACLLGIAGLGCEQPDDVVASLSSSSLSDDAGTPPPPPPPPTTMTDAGPDCSASREYVLLSSIVHKDCEVSKNPATLAALGAFYLQFPVPMQPGEARPFSTCDLFAGRQYFYAAENNAYYLCPGWCAFTRKYVEDEDARLLACFGEP